MRLNFLLDLYQEMLAQIGFTNLPTGAKNALIMTTTDFTGSPIVTNAYDKVISVGTVLVLMYFLINLLEESTRDNFTPEQGIKAFIKLAIAEIAVMKSDKIVVAFCNISNAMIKLLLGSLEDVTVSPVENAASATGTIIILCNIIMAFLPWVVSLLINVVLIVICFTRKIEVIVRATLMPIGISDIINGGYHSNGIRYLKRFIAVLFQGVVIVACCSASTSILNDDTVNSFANTFVFLPSAWVGMVQGILVLGLIKGASGIANELTG